MTVSRIQLRGISRDPSDRMTEDGGCAESYNAQIRDGEVASSILPEDVQLESGLPSESSMWLPEGHITDIHVAFIHQIAAEHFFICIGSLELGDLTTRPAVIVYPQQQVLPLGGNEIVAESSINAIGNTLIVSTDANVYYFRYNSKQNSYDDLGHGIPPLDIAVSQELSPTKELKEQQWLGPEVYSKPESFWEEQIAKAPEERDELVKGIIEYSHTVLQKFGLNSEWFNFPVFVRFAFRLYDGTYIKHTVPIFLDGQTDLVEDPKCPALRTWQAWVGGYSTALLGGVLTVEQSAPSYKIVSRLMSHIDLSKWGDIIKSIDMFISEPIVFPAIGEDLAGVKLYKSEVEGLMDSVTFCFGNTPDKDEMELKNTILDHTRNFYLVRSFTMDNINELMSGYTLENSRDLSYTELLYTHPTLPDDFRTNHGYFAERNYVINNRLVSTGVLESFYKGMPQAYGSRPTGTSTGHSLVPTYTIMYRLKDNDGTEHYVSAGPLTVNNYGMGYKSDMAQILFYPDTRCVGAQIIDMSGYCRRVQMTPHPYLNCAYWIGDLSKNFADLSFYDTPPVETAGVGSSYHDTYFFETTANNPFVYPAGGRISLPANIIAVSNISIPLSEGQLGDFDLYVFTDRGIWVVKSGDTIIRDKTLPLSRDIALSPDMVTPIDQAIVFATKNGVYILDGSQITPISDNMLGEPYQMEDIALSILEDLEHGREGFVKPMSKKETFISFMKDSHILYDYVGKRLLFVNPEKNYIYVYMLDSGTWHTLALDYFFAEPNEVSHMKVLNAFPYGYVTFNGTVDDLEYIYLYDCTTNLEGSSATERYRCVIATRPFDLKAPDVYKTIHHLVVRGKWDKGTLNHEPVRVILLGSNDGVNFTRVKSYHGKSFKMFRLIINAELKKNERISWVDIDFEPRFTNKLR